MYLKTLSVLLIAVTCSACALTGATLEDIDEPDGVYSWTDGALPAGAAPAVSPEFSCCEDDFEIREIGNQRIANVSVTLADGTVVSEVRLRFRAKIRYRCNRQLVESEEGGEGGTAEGKPDKCLGTFRIVEANAPATFTVNPGGGAMTPTAQRTWWDSSERRCDGRRRNATIDVAYIARYPSLGVPRVATGEPPSVIELDLEFKPDSGAGTRLSFFLKQLNQDRGLEIERVTKGPVD